MEEQDTQHNPDSVFLNPEYLEKLNEVPEVTDDEFREFILTYNYDIPDHLKTYVNEYMSNPLKHSDSKVLGWVKDWIEHPEKSKIYRDKFMFPNYGYDEVDEPQKGWKIEIPIISMEF